MMELKVAKPTVRVAGLTLIGNYWFQFGDGEEVLVEIPPIPLTLVFALEDFDGAGPPESETLPTDDPHTARWVFRSLKSLGALATYGTIRPMKAGWMGNLEIWLSYSMRRHRDTVFMSLAVYSKPKESDDAS
jgi:hypothetical protein